MKARGADWTPIVRKHAHDTVAFIVSSDHPSCLKMAKNEVDFINRRMIPTLLDKLPRKVPQSWFMAVIVCPGDDLAGLAKWMTTHGADRVRFYRHPRAPARLLAPIRDAGHDLRHVRPETYSAFGPLHKQLGRDLSDQIYEDFRPT